MENTFKIDLEKKVEDKSLNKKQAFSLAIPIEGYVYIRALQSLKTKQGNLSYSIKAAFLDGLDLLKNENPLVKDDAPLDRRYYKGGDQKSKIESFPTSVVVTKREVNWVNNYILQERQKDDFFSKAGFINNLVDQLKKKYGKSI
jgi:hypothetical protein